MTAQRDLDKQLDAYLSQGPSELPDASFDAVRDRIEGTHQRVFIGPWRTPIMNRLMPIALGGAAVVVALVVGTRFLGSPAQDGPGVAPPPTASAAPSRSAAPSMPSDGTLPVGPFRIDGAVPITIEIASPGWTFNNDFEGVSKDDDGLDAPETVGAVLLAWAWPAGTAFDVYGDPCHWSTTIPKTPATTPAEIAAAFADQAANEATAPVDVTVGGYAGKHVTLQVPMSYEAKGATREEKFGECDQGFFMHYGTGAGSELPPEVSNAGRSAQGAGQLDELWILDVDGSVVILDAGYSPATPAALLDEIRTLAESATFE